MKCPRCQAEIAEESSFCSSCGARIGTSTDISPVQPRPEQPSVVHARPLKDPSIALILEILPGLFGFLGFGWIYAGETSTGIMWLVVYLVVAIVCVIADVASGGICCFVTLPVQIVIIVLSVTRLNQYIKAHPELFTG